MNSNNEMFEGNILKTLLKVSFPIFIGMIFDLLFNITDTFFLALIDKSDTSIISGVGLIFPIAFLVIAITQGFYFGISTIVAIAVGRDNLERIKRTVSTGMYLAAISGVTVILLSFMFGRQIIFLISGSEISGEALECSYNYLTSVIPGALFLITSHVLLGVLQGEGKTKHIGYTMLISTAFNFILDPVLIFGLDMGVRGAGIATSIAQAIMLLYVVILFVYQKGDLLYSFRKNDVSIKELKEIMKFGIPQSLGMLSLGLSMIFINYVISSIGEDEMNAYTIVTRLDNLIIIPITAISFGLSSMIGQNYGRGLFSRVRKIYFEGTFSALVIAVFIALFYVVFSHDIINLFTGVDSVRTLAATQVMFLAHSLAIGVTFGRCSASAFQALEKPIMSLSITLIRTVGIILPVMIILVSSIPLTIESVWSSLILGNIISGILSIIFFSYIQMTILNNTNTAL